MIKICDKIISKTIQRRIYMKRLTCILLALLMTLSLFTAAAADKKTYLPADVISSGAVKAEGGKLTGLSHGQYFGIKGVDLTGIKSVKLEGKSFFRSNNCEIFQVRTDSPNGAGEVLGYVKFDELGENTFSANLKEMKGAHDVYFVAQFTSGTVTQHYAEVYKIIFSDEEVPAYVPVPDSAIIDNYADTWAATDSLGQSVADFEETGSLKGDRYVGMFFWNWHGKSENATAYLPWKVVEEHPDAEGNYMHEAWDLNGNFFWNEPVFGFYDSTDYWVYRKQAVLLANAGVDVVFFDNTNGPSAYYEALNVHYKAWRDARESGVNTPKISFFASWKSGRVEGIKFLYEEIFRDGEYSDLWFYWDGKPFIIADSAYVDQPDNPNDPVDVALTKEAFNFFTMRRSGARVSGVKPGDTGEQTGGQKRDDELQWLDNYPQYAYSVDETTGRPEFMSLGLAVNESIVWGVSTTGVFSDPYTKGRSYAEAFGEDLSEKAYLHNWFFREQQSRVLDSDPRFVFIDGWNEWTAGRQQVYSGVENAFVDTYDNRGSRDIEPTMGDLKDISYAMLVDFVRKYKGTRPAPVAGEEKTIDLNGDASQWDSVTPEFINDYDNYERDSYGYCDKDTKKKIHYTTNVNNSISRAKVSRDSENFYFYVKTVNDIKEGTPGWMNLYINADRNYATGWEGYEYTVNVTGTGKLSKNTGKDYSWQEIGTVDYKVSGNTLVVKIPRALLGETETADLEFKWTDSVDCKGDLVRFYADGSVAPMGRFNYVYTEIAQTAIEGNDKDNLAGTTVIGAGKGKMIVDGAKMKVYEADTRVLPVMMNGTLYIPADSLSDILGYGKTKVEYDAYDNMLFVTSHDLEDTKITDYRWTYTVLGSLSGAINGKDTVLSKPVTAIDGIIYVPVTYISEMFGLNVFDMGDGVFQITKYTKDSALIERVRAHLG